MTKPWKRLCNYIVKSVKFALGHVTRMHLVTSCLEKSAKIQMTFADKKSGFILESRNIFPIFNDCTPNKKV